jgi:hypothetical protein
MSVPVSLGTLYISNTEMLTFAGSGPLTLSANVADAFVGVEAGSHVIHTPLRLNSPTILHVVDSSVLTVGGPLRSTFSGLEFAKVSGGELRIDGAQSYRPDSLFIAIAGATTISTNAGGVAGVASLSVNIENTALVTFAASQRLAALRIGGGFQGEDVAPVAVLEANGSRVIHTNELAVDPTGTLDLADNALIVQATPETRASVRADVETFLAAGCSGGTWLGTGITSSTARSDPLTGLAASLNDRGDGTPLFTSFRGNPVDVNSIIVAHSYTGDANLDGLIDIDDYVQIDTGYLEQPAVPWYADGDFNYDDRIDIDDYVLIDSAFVETGDVAGVASTIRAVAVPEPGSALLAVAASAWRVLRWRRRR